MLRSSVNGVCSLNHSPRSVVVHATELCVVGISVAGHPDLFRRNPLPQLLPFRTKAWLRKWDGAGYFYPPSDTWVHEQLGYEEMGPDVPCGAYHFHNEEDWVKFRYRFEKPKVNFAKRDQNNILLPPCKFWYCLNRQVPSFILSCC